MIHYDKRATVQFINRLYTLLTQRKVQQPLKKHHRVCHHSRKKRHR